jgi:2-polyprenyl-6-hydroxyphenyl methylase/3-demethylubiquinone-9 3-methyltransferase
MSGSSSQFAQIASTTHACKCCGAASPLFGVTDFNKSCEDVRQAPAPLSGIPIYYYRCAQCGFIFTPAFDAFTNEDFSRAIYNEQYARFDPDYLDVRPRTNSEYLARIFAGSKEISILDYGGGSGQLATRLREQGFTHVETYDPFVGQFSMRPSKKYDLLLAFEVIEHSAKPREVLADMISLINQPGMALFSTAIQPPDIVQVGVSWWFIAPRNGHCSIHTSKSLDILANERGRRTVSTPSKIWHLLLDEVPPFAKHLSIPPK